MNIPHRTTKYAGSGQVNRHERRREFRTRRRWSRFATSSSGGGGGGGSTDTLIQSATRTNTNSGAASSSNHLFGMMWQMGDIPSTASVVVKVSGVEVRASFVNRAYYPDGSLYTCHVAIDDTTIAASSSRAYDFYVRTNSSFDDTDPATNFTTLLAAHDLKGEFTSVTETDTAGTRTHASGTMFAAFTYGDVSGRVEKVIASPCIERWLCWGYVKDGATGTGSADAHLKCYFHVTRWRNSDGTEKALYATMVPAQEEVAVASKKRLNYTLTFKDGSTTLGTYTSVQHPYHAQFATVRNTDDTNHARAICVSGSECWLITSRDKAYMRLCEGFYPFKDGLTPTGITPSASTNTFTPFSAQIHQPSIDSGGGSAGRGCMPQPDVIAWMQPSAANNRIARVCAHAGLHVGYHVRQAYGSNAIASPFILLMDDDTGDDSTTRWNADGLPNGSYISWDSRPAQDGENGGYVQYEGGSGVWTLSGGPSHASPYCAYQWFEEGEEYFLQALLDLFTILTIQRVGDIYGNRQALLWSGVGGGYAGFSGLGIPTTLWSATYIIEGSQERGTAWATAIALWSWTCPANRAYCDYIQALVMHMDNFLDQFLSYTPASLLATGVLYVREDVESTWQQGFICHQACRGKRQLGSPGYTALAEHIANYAIGHITGNLFKTVAYHGNSRTKAGAWDSSTNPFLDADDHLTLVTVSYVASTDVLTVDLSADSSMAAVRANYIHNNDECYISTVNDSLGAEAVIPGTSVGTKYYVINVAQPTSTTITFQLSTSAGGSAHDITGMTGSGTLLMRFLGSDGGAGTGPTASDYPRIALAAAISAYEAGIPVATAAGSLIDTMESWLSAQDYSANPVWELERT